MLKICKINAHVHVHVHHKIKIGRGIETLKHFEFILRLIKYQNKFQFNVHRKATSQMNQVDI